MGKQYTLFTVEVEELHRQMEERLCKAGGDDDKLKEGLDLFRTRREELRKRFKRLGEAGVQAIEDVTEEMK